MRRLALHWQILMAMILGALIGLALNSTAATFEYDGRETAMAGKRYQLVSKDSPDRLVIELHDTESDEVVPFLIDGSVIPAERGELRQEGIRVFATLSELDDATDNEAQIAYDLFTRHGRSTARVWGDTSKLIGDLFLRLLKMVSIPLIIVSLLSGVLSLGQVEQLGKMFSRTIAYYLCTSFLAILAGLCMVNLLRPGVQNNDMAPGAALEIASDSSAQSSLAEVMYQQLESFIPANPFEAVASGNFLSIISFTLAFGVFAILSGSEAVERIGDIVRACFDVMMKMTMTIIKLAPLGVLCFMLFATSTQGASVFQTLGYYMVTVFCALIIHATITLPLVLRFVARRSPWRFAQAVSPALLTAFGTASSNGTLPLTIACVEKRARISNETSSFVLPLGATVNMDGTALYEVVAVLFIAQWHGIDLSIAQQVIVAITALLASIGAAGIPHAGLVMMVIILQAVGLPTESQGLIIAVDRVLDMCRTSVNVWGDSCGCAVVARFESAGRGGKQ